MPLARKCLLHEKHCSDWMPTLDQINMFQINFISHCKQRNMIQNSETIRVKPCLAIEIRKSRRMHNSIPVIDYRSNIYYFQVDM